MKKLNLSGLLALFLAVWTAVIAVGQETPPEPGSSRGLFVVEDALAQFQALKHHGEALAWILPEADGAPDPSLPDHYQGLARYPGKSTPIFYITQRDDDDPTVPGAEAEGGYLHVVRFGTRPTDGERLRSNLQAFGTDTKHTYPNSDDIWQRAIRFDGTLSIDGELLPAYEHPGGMAVVDNILFVALDTPKVEDAGHPQAQIVLFDLSADPENPIAIHAFPLNHALDNLAVTEQTDGTFLIWVNGDGGEATRFYQTTSTNLRHELINLELVQVWDHHSSADWDNGVDDEFDQFFPWPTGTSAYQSSTFIRQPDGSLFMIGVRHELVGDIGKDYADLLAVQPKSDGGFKLVRISIRKFHCEYRMAGGFFETDGRICNFAAAGSAYVSPTGELILYAMPHDDEDSNDPDYVRIGEFRHWDVNREGSPLRVPAANANGPYTAAEGDIVTLNGDGTPKADRPWVELYDDDHWNDRSIVVDYDDRSLLELNNFENLDGFGDKPTSIRWRMPVGLDAELFVDQDFGGQRVILRGTGQTETIADLNSQVVVPGVVEQPGQSAGADLDFGKASSMRFVGAPPEVNLTWDLDDDGVFGETGAAAQRGDEVGATPAFSATGLDGPGQVSVTMGVTEGDSASESTAVINLLNVAPTAVFSHTSGEIIKGEATLLTFTDQQDPSPADEAAGFTYAYDCTSDGSFDLTASPQEQFSCTYPQAGTFTAQGIIADKDDGATAYTVTVSVLTPAEAITRLVDLAESMNLQQGIDNSLDAKLEAALKALDDLNDNNTSAAVNNLQAFINSVEAQRDTKISAEQADSLTGLAQRIIDSLISG